MISLRSVTKRFAGATSDAVHELSLDVFEGEVVVLVGPSGCGKTTTMRMINRLIEPTSGTIVVEGTDVMKRDPVELRRGIGYVIQTVWLMPHRTVAQNIATVPDLLGWEQATDARTRRRDGHAARAGSRAVGSLPVGALRRTAAAGRCGEGARRRPSRDADGRAVRRRRPRGPGPAAGSVPGHPATRLRKTIVFVTHDIDEAIKMADRIAILNVGGIVEQYAPPEEILRVPASAFVADFVGRGARVEAAGAHRGPRRGGRARCRSRRMRRRSATTRRCAGARRVVTRAATEAVVDGATEAVAASSRSSGSRASWRVMACSRREPMSDGTWVGDHLGEIGSRLLEHLELTIIAVAIGFAISFPLAILAHRRRWTYAPVTWIAGILYTIPSLSLFVILIPITGLSATTVAIGLVSYTLLILIRNTAAGLAGVPPTSSTPPWGWGSRDARCSGTWRSRSRCP